MPATPATSKSPQECCVEKDRLQRSYAFATADYSRAVQVLQRYTGVMDREEYRRLLTFSETARLKCDEARLMLELHLAEHGC